MKEIETAAQRLREASESGIPCAPIRDLIGETDIASAYAVQEINTNLRLAEGARIIGKKIGLTNAAIQSHFGIDQPDYGMLWHDMEVENGGELSVSQIIQPKTEAEIAFVLGKDLDMDKITSIDVMNAIDYALPSLELVGSRVSNWDIKITDTIADNASASHWVVGHTPTKISDFDMIKCQMTMSKNGQVVSEGTGANCLGSPINATVWLAQMMRSVGQPLKAGDLILTGALGPFIDIAAGDHFVASIEGLGEVSVTFSE